MQSQDQSQQTGTQNETYNVISILYHALQGAENCQTYLQDAEDGPIRDFVQQALQSQRQLADRGKEVLQQVLQNDSGGSSAFGWGQSQGQQNSGQGQQSLGQGQQGMGQGSGQQGESEGLGQGVSSSRSGLAGTERATTFGEQSGGQGQATFADQEVGNATGGGNF
jgi:hypothetical protein